MTKPPPPTDEEHHAWVREYERKHSIPGYLHSVKKWLTSIRADAADIRNTSNKKIGRGGLLYIDESTNLDAIESHAATVRRLFDAGDDLLARSSLDGLKGRINAANQRLVERELKAGRSVLNAAARGANAKAEGIKFRDAGMARRFLDLKSRRPDISDSAAKAAIGAEYRLNRSAAIEAVNRGLKIVRSAAKPDD